MTHRCWFQDHSPYHFETPLTKQNNTSEDEHAIALQPLDEIVKVESLNDQAISWAKNMDEKYNSLPPEIKKMLDNLNNDIEKGIQEAKGKPKRGRPKKEPVPKVRKPYEYTEKRREAYERMKTARDEKRLQAKREKEDEQAEKALKNLIVKKDKNTIKKVKKVIKRHELSDSDSEDSEAERRIMRKLKLQKARKNYYSSEATCGSSDEENAVKPKSKSKPSVKPKVQKSQNEDFGELMFV